MPAGNYFYFLRFFLIASIPFLFQIVSIAQDTKADSVLNKTEQFIKELLYQSHDTAYIDNFSQELALKALGVTKYTYFQVNDNNLNSSIRYRPGRQVNLGFGVAYKWFAIDIAFNVGLVEDTELEESDFLDIQARIFGRKHYLEFTYQYYYGYTVQNVEVGSNELKESSRVRDDIRSINFVLQYLYPFNHGKFSLTAPFVLNELQKKSAGSAIGGVNFSLYVMDADSSVIPLELADDFSESLYLQDLNVASVGLNFGYMYTFVLKKHFFLTLSFIPGISINMGDYRLDVRNSLKTGASLRIRTMNALGYNGRRFFVGIQGSGNLINVKIDKNLNVDTGHGNAKIFVGYRFADVGHRIKNKRNRD